MLKQLLANIRLRFNYQGSNKQTDKEPNKYPLDFMGKDRWLTYSSLAAHPPKGASMTSFWKFHLWLDWASYNGLPIGARARFFVLIND